MCLNDLFLHNAAPRVLSENEQDEQKQENKATDRAEGDTRNGAGLGRRVDGIVGGWDCEDVLLALFERFRERPAAEAVAGDGG